MKPPRDQAVILFDGVCNLCHASVLFIIKHDKKKSFVFAALQSDVASELLLHFPKEIIQKDSIILAQNNKIYTESTAALRIAKELTGFWIIIQVFWIFPKFIRDYLYKVVAKNRYYWFGKKENCMVPNNAIKNRFL